jgi:hypothetical protein
VLTLADLVGIPVYSGLLITILANTARFQAYANSDSRTKGLLGFSLFLAGWFFMSYPQGNADFSPWFNFLNHYMIVIFPAGVNIFNQSILIGIPMLLIGCLLSTRLQAFFAHPSLLWLGELSL